jgi:periplasmic divalent cation tolerance protein
MSEDCCVVFVTVGNRAEAESLAVTLVKERLAACCNMISGVDSVYRWQGKICRDEEILLIIKTRREKFEALRARVVEIHSYDVPEVVALPIVEGHDAYMQWLLKESSE